MNREEINKYFNNLIQEVIDRYPKFSFNLFAENGEVFDDLTYHEIHQIYADMGIDIKHGISKVVFIFDDGNYSDNYVVKIPLNFYNINYCEHEENLYEEVKNNRPDLEKFFAECWCGGYIKVIDEYEVEHRIPFYIMRRADVNEDVVSSKSYDYWIKSGRNADDYFYDGEESVFDCLREVYEDKDINELLEFLSEMDVNDIHAQNIGFIKDEAVLIDYSGFESWNSFDESWDSFKSCSNCYF